MKANKKGFTFLELVISSLIFSMIMVSLYFAFNTGMFGYRHIGDTLSISYGALKALENVNSDLRNSFVFQPERAGLGGNNTQIEFFTLNDNFLNGTGIADFSFVSYRLQDGKFLRFLRRNKNSLLNNTSGGVVLCSGVKDLSFSYAKFDPQTKLIQWEQVWQSNQTLPAAVKVTLNLTGRRQVEHGFARTIYIPLSSQ